MIPLSEQVPSSQTVTLSAASRQASPYYDVVIAGGGFAGLALALALFEGSHGQIKLAVVDAHKGHHGVDTRSSAIAFAAVRMLQTLQAWPSNPADTQPILDMMITDSRMEDGARPSLLNFCGTVEDGQPFAYMVENTKLADALLARAQACGIEIYQGKATGYEAGDPYARLVLADQAPLQARLIVACDGARSAVRQSAGLQLVGWDYPQSGIATTILHERPHNGRAMEHFLPAGPFAVLPLPDDAHGNHRSSIVWTQERTQADALVALDDAAFLAALLACMGHSLGRVQLAGPRHAHPLRIKIAREFIAPRLALVADSAHTMHPISGQGMNMGFRDVAALAQVVVEAARLGQDIGALDVLEQYQRWRRFDTLTMGVATEGMNRLFSNDITPVRLIRDLGLGIVERLPRIKSFFIRSAAGLEGEVPLLMRGRKL